MDLNGSVRYRFGMFVRLTIQGALVALITALPTLAEARFFRSEQVPNGQRLDCSLCHIASNGDGPRNEFGTQIEEVGLDGNGEVQNQSVVWAELYMLDADGDGFTNGYELGDPDGEWSTGDNDPSVDASFPGDPDSVPCGNGSVHPDEECDGEDFADATCESLGFAGGDLACNADCTLDTSACMAAPDMGMGGMSDVGQDADDAGTIPGSDGGSTSPQNDTGQSTTGQTNQNGGPSGNGNPHPYFDNPPPTGDSGSGCGGSLEVRENSADAAAATMDAGATDASMLLLLPLLGLRRRRRRG